MWTCFKTFNPHKSWTCTMWRPATNSTTVITFNVITRHFTPRRSWRTGVTWSSVLIGRRRNRQSIECSRSWRLIVVKIRKKRFFTNLHLRIANVVCQNFTIFPFSFNNMVITVFPVKSNQSSTGVDTSHVAVADPETRIKLLPAECNQTCFYCF